jgi:hypothetical protein
MASGAITSFCDDGKQPRAEVVLANGDQVQLLLNRDGVTITATSTGVLFQGNPEVVSQICVSLASSTETTTPLQILLSVVTKLGSADEVREAFRQATAERR